MAQRDLALGGAIPMDPGARDRSVTIQQLAESVGGSNYPVGTWSTLTTAWMRKRDLKGWERFKAAQVSAPAETLWEMGYRPDMDPDLVDVPKTRRLVYEGRIYDITAASQIGRREGVELMTLGSTKVA